MSTTDFDDMELFERDENAEKESGIDLKFPAGQIITILRAGGSNRNYDRTFQRITQPFRWAIRKKTLSDEQNDQIMREVYADAVIVGWKNVKSKGKEIPFTRDNVIGFLARYPEAFEHIMMSANDPSLFRAVDLDREEVAEDLGNDLNGS